MNTNENTNEFDEYLVVKYFPAIILIPAIAVIIVCSALLALQVFIGLIALASICFMQSFYFISTGMGEHDTLSVVYSLLTGLAGVGLLFVDYKIVTTIYCFIAKKVFSPGKS